MVVFEVPVNGCNPVTIVLGRRGTYNTQEVTFDLSYLVENYGAGTAVLMVKRSQDTSAYPAVVSQEDNILTWIVSDVDTYYPGSGECQLMWYVDEGLAKTIIYPMVVMRDILQTTEEPPDGYENWIESLTALGAETQQNAQEAKQSATEAKSSEDSAAESAQRAEDAAGLLVDVSATATTLDPGQPATAEYNDGVFEFGIPKGDKLTYADLTEADKEDLVQGPIKDAQDDAVEAVGTAKTNAVDAVNQAGTTQKNAVNQAGTTQKNAVTQEGTTQVGRVTTEGNTQVNRVQAKGDEVIASIPSDYSDLADDVSGLTRHINENVGYTSDKYTPYQTASGWALDERGYSYQKSSYGLVKYSVTAGDNIYIHFPIKDAIMQFQSDYSVPSSGTQYIVGDVKVGYFSGVLTVPTGATFLIMSVANDDNYSGVYRFKLDSNIVTTQSVASVVASESNNGTYVLPVTYESGTWNDAENGAGRPNSKRLRSTDFLYSPTGEIVITSNPDSLNWFVLEFDSALNMRKTSGTWQIDSNYTLTYPYFKLVLRKANDTVIALIDADNFVIAISSKVNYGFEFFRIAPDVTVNGYYLDTDGLAHPSSVGTKIYKYNIARAKSISLVSNTIYQFQSDAYIPGSGTNQYIVGDVVTNKTVANVAVPAGATWVIINAESGEANSGVYRVEYDNDVDNTTVAPNPLLYTGKYIGHRGGGKTAPENTIPSLEQGYTNGFRIFEFDIQFTSDNIPVLLHDETINGVARNSDGSELANTIYINSITYQEALQYDFGIRFGSAYAGTKIATLDEALLWIKRRGCCAEIDISGTSDFTEVKATIIYNIVKNRGMNGSAFYTASMSRLLQVANNGADICVCVSNIGTSESAVSSAAVARGISIFTFASVQYPYLTEAQINLVHKYGMYSKAFTLDTLTDLETVYAYGSDMAILHNLYPNEIVL